MDKVRLQRQITVYKEVDRNGVKHDVDAKVFNSDGTEVTCDSLVPPRKWEVGIYACSDNVRTNSS